MLQALVGFVTVWVVIGVGWLAAHLGFFTDGSRRFMSRTAFVIASPALLLMMVSRADLGRLFTGTLVVSILAVVVSAWVFHLDPPSLLAVTVMGGLSSATNIYVIAGRYGVAERLARDAIFWSTILCMPVIFAASAVLR